MGKIRMVITGKIMEYQNEKGESYRLLFGLDFVTRECLSGSTAGSIRTVSCGVVEIDPNVFFIAWSEDNGDAVSMVADTNKNSLHSWHLDKGGRRLCRGTINNFTNAQIKDNQGRPFLN